MQSMSAYIPSKSPEVPSPREASFQNGVGMLAGQNNGAMLGDLLARLSVDELYDYVVFFDDGEKNVSAVTDWFSEHRIATVSFLYQGEATKFPGHDLERTDSETAALLGVFEAFDGEELCAPGS